MHLPAPRLRTWHQFVHLLQLPKLTAILSTSSTSTALGPSREFRARAATGTSITTKIAILFCSVALFGLLNLFTVLSTLYSIVLYATVLLVFNIFLFNYTVVQ